MKITLDQWKELHGHLKWEVQLDTRWPLSIRIRYWQSESGLAVKEFFGVNGEMDYEMFQASMIPHSNAYDRSVLGEPLSVTRQ